MFLKRRVTALLLCFILLLGAVPPAPAVEIIGYFIAVDQWIPDPMTDDTMPAEVNGQIYLPEGLLTHPSSGLGIGFARSDSNTLVLYKRALVLTFDLTAGNATDQDGTVYDYKAVVLNGRAYFPARKICAFFNFIFDYELTQFEDFPLIRISTTASILSSKELVRVAYSSLYDRRSKYLQNMQQEETPVETTPEPDDSGTTATRRVYLACVGGDERHDILDTLEDFSVKALVLLTPEEIREEDDLVRRVVAQGHTIGINLNGLNETEVISAFESANDALVHIARVRTAIVSADKGVHSLLAEAGAVIWSPNITVRNTSEGAQAMAAQVLAAIDSRTTSYVSFESTQAGSAALRRLLQTLVTDETYRLRLPTVTSIY